MKRIHEIIATIRNQYPDDDFFSDFEYSCRINPFKKSEYRIFDKALMVLDNDSWQILKKKALQHYRCDDDRPGQRKQGFFNQLNEAFAYKYLVNNGFENVRFVKEGRSRSPDISFTIKNKLCCCEVKTLGISDKEINRRSGQLAYDGNIYVGLDEGFLKKFKDAVNEARQQITAFNTPGVVYIIIRFDDFTKEYYYNYRKQLLKFFTSQGFGNLFVKMGPIGSRRIAWRITFSCK